MTNALSDDRVLLLWSNLDGERIPTLRDGEGQLLFPFNEFLDDVSRDLRKRAASPSQSKAIIDSAAYAMKSLCVFLAKCGKTITDLDEALLEDYREDALDQVKLSKTYRGDENAAKRTVNIKLRCVYQLLYFSQKAHRLPKGTIGWLHCKVQSSWPLADESPTDLLLQDRRKNPLCYRNAGENSRDDNSQYFATKKDVARLEEHFWRQSNRFASMRNVVMLRLLEHAGWRVGSLNSLTTRQFSEAALASQAQLDQFTVVPPHQKGGHSFTFGIPFELACQVAEFVSGSQTDKVVAGSRAECLASIGASELQAEERLFVSVKTGEPLTDHAVSEIFADAFKSIDAPKGSGAHSIRRFVGQDCANEEVAFRRANNLSLDRDDVERAIQEKLGHSSVLSQRVYRRALAVLRRSDQVARLQNELLENQGKLVRLNGDLAQAEQSIRELKAALAAYPKPRKTTSSTKTAIVGRRNSVARPKTIASS